MKMHDLGGKIDKTDGPIPMVESYPSLHLDSKKMPEIKKLKIGDTATFKVKAKVKSITAREDKNGDMVEMRFDMMSCGMMDNEDNRKSAREMAEMMTKKA